MKKNKNKKTTQTFLVWDNDTIKEVQIEKSIIRSLLQRGKEFRNEVIERSRPNPRRLQVVCTI